MGEALLNTVGLIAGLAGLANLANTEFQPQAVQGTAIRVKLGLSNDSVTGQGGVIDSFYAFDYGNNYLGETDGGNPGAGDVLAVTINQEEPNRQGRYISISAGDDDVCVLVVTVNNNDMLYTGSWNGDIGFNCGQGWYHGGGEPVGMITDANGNQVTWAPRCAWFGPPQDTHGAVSYAWKFNTVAYGDSSNETIANNQICDATIYSADQGVISDQPGGVEPSSKKKRSITSLPLPANRPDWIEQTLVISSLPSQTSEELCTHGMSWGPDFVDSKGLYCDMKTKTLSPLCTSTNDTGCVTWSDDAQTISKRSTVARRTTEAVHKSFKSVQRWGQK